MGFDEVGVVIPHGDDLPSPAFIRRGGIPYATLDPFGDGTAGLLALGGTFAGRLQAIDALGWDMVAGAEVGGDVVKIVMNHLPYCNRGAVDSSNVYDPPYNHPVKGPNTYHVDYISTFNQEAWYYPCMTAMTAAAAAGGCAEVGISIGLQENKILDSSIWYTIIDAARDAGLPCNNVCFYGGVELDPVTNKVIGVDGVDILQNAANEVLMGLIHRYGTRHGIGST